VHIERECRLQRPDGVTVAYRVATAARAVGAPAVVLLHGLASNLTRWSEFVEHTSLGRIHDVIRIDLRGHGGSLTRRPIGLDRWCGDLEAVLEHEGNATAVLVGHSLGAQVALHFAARHPQRTAGLVLIDPVFRQALHGRWRLLALAGPLFRAAAAMVRALNALGVYRRELPALDLRALDTMARRALASKDAEDAFIRQYSSTRADLRYVPLAVYLQDLVEMFRPVPGLHTLAAPTLVLLSTGATFADATEMGILLRRSPLVELQSIDCHHWPLTERPEEVRRAIEHWCARSVPHASPSPNPDP
jgi:pimeloyl-ACP methyl ester carboxylesterase